MFFTREQMRKARITDLYNYLLTNHANAIVKEGSSLRLIANHSLSIKLGYSGYYDFSTGDKGNSIDFLVKYLGYSIPEAVLSLANYNNKTAEPVIPSAEVHLIKADFPKKGDPNSRKAIDYLVSRGLSESLVRSLIKANLIYQDEHNNVVFINRECNYAEIRGTSEVPFKSIRKPKDSNVAWYFNKPFINTKPHKCYICESAIDAISLFMLLCENAFYISIGGVGNQRTIDSIKQLNIQVILAVDNDSAGDACRIRNQDMEFIIPSHKDWNDDLIARMN
ncbi:Protein of unknown function [Butyrivibrio sp. ob235]|uniref:toprim domain-containing protein n=1 Tax=Butyrivibrio sp. ob235 TaxID=1761780 RepID=UPI0008BEC6E9|nr:toprim domain-containing protein [Butyrivibrio sp. ob235]SEK64870.1 Protein of unknown function [Butyrivibrio sp. ob235]